jgi:type I restriction enzyme S subunit
MTPQGIPPGWQVRTLADLGGRVTSGSRGWAKHYAEHGSLFVRITNLTRGDIHLDLEDPRFVRVDPNEAEARRTRLEVGDLLISITADIGIIGYVDDRTPSPAYINQHIARVRLDPQLADSRFVADYLASWEPQRRFVGATDQGAKAGMNLTAVAGLTTVVPPLDEQSRIADALADAGNLITNLGRLIAKKQAIKRGMMQSYFRLPPDDRQRATLGTLVAFLSGGTPDRANVSYWSGSIPWISATTLKRLEVGTSDQAVTERAVRAGSKMAPLHSTLVLVRGSALHSEIRASLVVAPVCFNQDVKAMIPSSRVEPKFLTYSIHANASRLLRLVTSAGNTAGVLDTKVLKDFEIWLPDRDTQQRVTSVFDDVAAELGVLEHRLDKAQAIKRGMLQQLLTGRTRLPIPETAA